MGHTLHLSFALLDIGENSRPKDGVAAMRIKQYTQMHGWKVPKVLTTVIVGVNVLL